MVSGYIKNFVRLPDRYFKGDTMRKIRIVFWVAISLFLNGCADNEVLNSLPGYTDSVYSTSGGYFKYDKTYPIRVGFVICLIAQF